MEQPEIHLHPQVQAELADVFISAIDARENGKKRNVQLIVESHSEHFLNRLQRRIAEGKLTPDDVAIYFCHRSGSSTELQPLTLDIFGGIENWPENFFGDEMADIAARTLAANERKSRKNTGIDQCGL
jgi:predicted ATPase